ncbi:hypothetical protein Q0Z83_023390 [Actinoplanes sichuanensis]|uniref:Tetratricopeptide repeat protein n=1 Tax=Actinoplanes sichuanensis TaxID=512349 RepID=A0ABW4A0J1_9ACTN|nr:hypothetical protein [Actinoplanes sichuanensis]BEL04148.1 hypothetical protein Q0Z83_023390 [Actinoplanes sichuanensis]
MDRCRRSLAVGEALDDGLAEARRVLDIADELGDPRSRSSALEVIGVHQLRHGDPDAAIASLRESAELIEEFGHELGESTSGMEYLGEAYLAAGDARAARRF